MVIKNCLDVGWSFHNISQDTGLEPQRKMLKNEPDMYIINQDFDGYQFELCTIVCSQEAMQWPLEIECSLFLLSSWPRFPSYSPEPHASAQLPGEDCRLPGPQCGGTRAAVHGIQRHPAFSAGRTWTRNWLFVFRGYPMNFTGLHMQEPTCSAHILIPTSGIIMPYVFFPEPLAGDVHPAAGEEATGALEHRWRDRRYERGPGSTCEGQSKRCSTDPFQVGWAWD